MKELEIITKYIEKIEEYEKKTGKQYPAIYISKKLCIAIKEKLQRLEAIDNANSSEALKGLQSIADVLWDDDFHYQRHSKLLNIIEQALIKAQEQDFNYKNIVIPFFDELVNVLGTNDTDEMLDKIKEQEKVLEIIKKKCLGNDNLYYVRFCINYDEYKEKNSKRYDTVEVKIRWKDKNMLDYLGFLTQDEFDFLKRWLV